MKKLLIGLLALVSISAFAKVLEGEFYIHSYESYNGNYNDKILEKVQFEVGRPVKVELENSTCIFQAHGDKRVYNIDVTVTDLDGNNASVYFDVKSKMKFYTLQMNKTQCHFKWMR